MATLVYSDVDGVDRSFALGGDPVIVGRGAECQIRSEDPRVSRMHARFFLEQGALWVEDLGSSNGIFVGPNKVARAPVPTGEIILVGSLMIRLLPASGTLPPPVGLHGTLASWLDMERKVRAVVEEERDAFARRVGEMHQQLAQAMQAPTLNPDAPESEDPQKTSREITSLGFEITRLSTSLEAAERARSIAEHAHGEAMREAQTVRDELAAFRKATTAELEA
ncbi:MAG TPA: FHA domain-containing protein, partial [Kofleriaceae bacterium]